MSLPQSDQWNPDKVRPHPGLLGLLVDSGGTCCLQDCCSAGHLWHQGRRLLLLLLLLVCLPAPACQLTLVLLQIGVADAMRFTGAIPEVCASHNLQPGGNPSLTLSFRWPTAG